MKNGFISLVSLFIAFAPQAEAKDLGMFNGVPTPALAMYAAQTKFAAEKCVSEGLTSDTKGAASFVKYFDRGIQLRLYQKKDEDFVRDLDSSLNNYATAWSAAAPEIRRHFCDGFNSEIAVKKDGFFRWMMPLNYFRYKFSPNSEAARARQRKLAGIASVAGAVVTATTTVSAAQDSVSSAKAGDWSTSNQQMALSRGFNQLGVALTGAGAAAPEGANDAASVLEEKSSDGTLRIVRCPVIDHFFSFSEPTDSPIWMTYQKVSMPCRDLTASDLTS